MLTIIIGLFRVAQVERHKCINRKRLRNNLESTHPAVQTVDGGNNCNGTFGFLGRPQE